MKQLNFIDLFAGIGGFHIAMKSIHPHAKCVYACEIDKICNDLYKNNFKISPEYDIRQADIENIPSFEVLFAGFPCQPFSKGGKQMGFKDQTRGTLFFNILQIIEFHRPNYILLENVANIVSHDQGNTYQVIKKSLTDLGYLMPSQPLIISPVDFGYPVNRKRAYIIARRKNEFSEKFLTPFQQIENNKLNAIKFYNLKQNNTAELKLSALELKILNMWEEFKIGIKMENFGFPIWMDQFNDSPPEQSKFKWKNEFILKNKALYQNNKKFIDKWKAKYRPEDWITNKSHMKLEWQAGKQMSIFDGLIQFRPSGIRISSPDKFNTLVAMGHTQIIGPFKRKLSISELKALQAIPKSIKISKNRTLASKQIGNSIHIEVVKNVLNYLID